MHERTAFGVLCLAAIACSTVLGLSAPSPETPTQQTSIARRGFLGSMAMGSALLLDELAPSRNYAVAAGKPNALDLVAPNTMAGKTVVITGGTTGTYMHIMGQSMILDTTSG